MPDEETALYFRFFTEIGIINQLSRALLEARLPEGVLVPHFLVLNHLVRVEDGRTPLALARAFQTAKTSMTHTLAGLEMAGLIEMHPNPQDARSKRVWITEKGRSIRTEAIRALAPDVAEIASEFGDARVRELLPGLEALRAIMDRQREDR